MPPQEMTGIASSVRPNRRYFMDLVIARAHWTGNSRPRPPREKDVGKPPANPAITERPTRIRHAPSFHSTMLNIKNAQLVRPLNLPWLPCFFLAVLLALSVALAHGEPPAPRAYDNTVATVTKISAELHQALDAGKRRELRAEPKFLTGLNTPWIAPSTDAALPANAVVLSSGFVDLLNHLAHAKALDESVSGYFDQYVRALPQDGSTPLEPVGKALSNEQVWNFDTMNYQISIFNQMTGTLLAIEMAHHYLGHSKKHGANSSAAGKALEPFTEKLTEKEWREAVLKGARNALDCGLGVDGFRTILAAVEKLPTRPKWSACFVHPKADTSKLNRELEKLEKDFFLVEK